MAANQASGPFQLLSNTFLSGPNSVLLPLVFDDERVQAIVDAQRKTGKKVTVTFNARHSPTAKKIRQLLQEKAIGDVIAVECQE